LLIFKYLLIYDDIMDFRKEGKFYRILFFSSVLLFLIVLPALKIRIGSISYDWTHGLIIVALTNMAFVWSAISKGNPRQVRIDPKAMESCRKIWADSENPSQLRPGKGIMTIGKIGFLISFAFAASVIIWPGIPSYLGVQDPSVLLIFSFIMCAVFIFIVVIVQMIRNFPTLETAVYHEGMKVMDHFLPWKDIESLSYVKTFHLEKALPKVDIRSSLAYSGDGKVLKITMKTGEEYVVVLRKESGFEDALESAGHSDLLG
jgi:hypothetical protein